MSMQLRYRGGFYSYGGVLWGIELFQENAVAFDVEEIAFTDSPLEIDWPERDKMEPVESSKATLSLFSDSDRQFIDLYTVVAGSIRMDVYREGLLYWSGTLDPELYEEPFSYNDGYGVTITFSDLAILDRLNWSESGFKTLEEIIRECLALSGINFTEIQTHISTKLSSYESESILTASSLLCDNFFDEDNTPMTVREVLDETLRPFSLRLIQKAGNIIIYDLNQIYYAFNPQDIEWTSDDAVLSVDKVYNNVKVAYSPYEKVEVLNAEVDEESVPESPSTLVRVDYKQGTGGVLVSPEGFNIVLSDTGSGVEKGSQTKYFRILPVYSGDEAAGVAWTFDTKVTGGSYVKRLRDATSSIGDIIYTASQKAYIASAGLSRYKIRLSLEMLFDVRYNPFEEAGKENEGGNWSDFQNKSNLAYVPFLLTLRDANGVALYHWENKQVYQSSSYDQRGKMRWNAGEGSWGDAYLCYYDPGNRRSSTGLGGWKNNKQIIGFYQENYLPVIFSKQPDGEYIDLPPVSGWLELKIGSGVICYDYEREITQDYTEVHWALYGKSSITLVDKYGNDVEEEDIEHNAWLNRAAKESLEIETFIGTLRQTSPTALGQVFRTSDKAVIGSFYRAGRQDLLERLLIGTIYSNYADRHVVISGSAGLMPYFGVYADRNEPGKFILLSEVQRLREDESEIKMARFDADSYEGIEYE